MCSPRRPRLLVPALLCALAVLVVRPTDATDAPSGPGARLGTEATRLYERAATATRQYEAGRRADEEERERVRRIGELLDRQRRKIEAMNEDLGRITRERYRGGGLPVATHRLDGTAGELMRGHRELRRAELAINHAIENSRRAGDRLTADEARAAAAWQPLERGNTELAVLKQDIERTLETARGRPQGRADASAAAGSCPAAVRLYQPEARFTRAWVAPVETYGLSASFGSGGKRWAHRHTGQDFAVPVGTPVRAVGAGRVVRVSCAGAFGMQVVLQHADGYCTQYAHLSAIAVEQGDRVGAGQWIGRSGSTGNSSGPHLHFEVRATPSTGSALDPVPWLERRGVTW
ncbi:hypothetical protein SUDANB58_02948 [Streptomyces sp. enrichment culture]|uniref:M23 family metallopeptidase n=1 Tax=Streptomyces sp. enrichment culture TaxID=1795815 RepID=UPI003F57C4B2